MAEELDIKSIWEKGKELEDPSSLEINTLEKKGTKTTLYWIKVILWIEFSLNLVLAPLSILYALNRGDSTGLIIFYLVVTIIYLIYYQFLIKKINQFNYDGNVVKSLKKVYGYLRFYLLHYKVVIWLSLIIGFIYGFTGPENREGLDKINSTEGWIIVISITVVIVGIFGGILHGLVNLIYGRKIKRLKKTLQDLQKEE